MKKYVLTLMMSISLVQGASEGMKIYGKTCVECHGADGKDTSIAGKAIAGGSGALAKLTGYKNGTYGGGQKETMQANVSALCDADLKAVAEYVDTLK
jgi:cytochrome c